MSILKPEIEEGNVEYKRFLINIDDTRLEQLATQMNWRLEEGDNEAIYYLGVNDNGSIYKLSPIEKMETFKNFNLLVEKNKAETKLRINELKREECMILLQAKKDIAKFKTERYILKGYDEKKAKRIVERDIKEQELDCID